MHTRSGIGIYEPLSGVACRSGNNLLSAESFPELLHFETSKQHVRTYITSATHHYSLGDNVSWSMKLLGGAAVPLLLNCSNSSWSSIEDMMAVTVK